MSTTLADRLSAKIDKTDPSGCWLWTASRKPCGYGQINLNGRPRPAHRVVYELLVGPIPAGLQLDHLCRVRSCVNPEHLEPVTSRENTRRGRAVEALRELAAQMTHCKSGHPLSGPNMYVDAKGHRLCRACRRGWARQALGPRPTTRRRGPLVEALVHERRTSQLACGHTVKREGGGQPRRMRCTECATAANDPPRYLDEPPERAE
jgi:hypothetical protein